GRFLKGAFRADGPDRARRKFRGNEERVGRLFSRSALRAVRAATGAGGRRMAGSQVGTRVLRPQAAGGQARAAYRTRAAGAREDHAARRCGSRIAVGRSHRRGWNSGGARACRFAFSRRRAAYRGEGGWWMARVDGWENGDRTR